jgi:hypothetical protein
MAEEASAGGGNALLGVIVGAILVVVVLFFVFGGWDWISGNDGGVDVDVDVPAIEVR